MSVIYPQAKVLTKFLSSNDESADVIWETVSKPDWLVLNPSDGVLNPKKLSAIQMTVLSSELDKETTTALGNWSMEWTRSHVQPQDKMSMYTTTFPGERGDDFLTCSLGDETSPAQTLFVFPPNDDFPRHHARDRWFSSTSPFLWPSETF